MLLNIPVQIKNVKYDGKLTKRLVFNESHMIFIMYFEINIKTADYSRWISEL